MMIKIGNHELENDIDCKCISDGWEIFGDTVTRLGIDTADFESAYWQEGSIIVEDADTDEICSASTGGAHGPQGYLWGFIIKQKGG